MAVAQLAPKQGCQGDTSVNYARLAGRCRLHQLGMQQQLAARSLPATPVVRPAASAFQSRR